MVNLTKATPHKLYKVTKIPEAEEIACHLQELGLIPGSQTILLKTQGKNGILLLDNRRIALDQTILAEIMVEEVTSENEVLSLDQLAVGETAKVKTIFGEGALRRRLMDMGITKGVEITIRKLAPLGDPMELALRGYALSIRKSEAESVLVEKETHSS